jgi:hypothetical protein
MTLRHPPGLSPDGFELVGSLAIPRVRLRADTAPVSRATLLHFTTTDGWQSSWSASAPSGFDETILGTAALDAVRAVADVRGSYAGIWDLVAWRDEQVLFITAKTEGACGISEGHAGWLAAALAAGLTPEDFLVVESAGVPTAMAGTRG